jgi:hypothetical protein
VEPEAGQNAPSDEPGPKETTEDAGERPPWVGVLLGLAILAAPFLALLYGFDAGLAVMALALAAVGLLAFLAARTAEPELRQRLLVVAAVNAVLAFACVVLLAVRQ